MANKVSSTLIFNISYHRHQGLLECQTFVTNHALFNASRSIVLFLVSGGLSFSESAVITVLFHIIIIYYCHYYCDNGSHLLSCCTTRYMNYFTCDVKLT